MVGLYQVVLQEGVAIPERATFGSSGFDLRAFLPTTKILLPMERVVVPTGVCISMPQGVEAQVRSRSGLAAKHGIMVLNSPGTIDSDYTGDIGVVLINLGANPFAIEPGDRIAQLVFQKIEVPSLEQVEALSPTDRSSGGFGSTGLH